MAFTTPSVKTSLSLQGLRFQVHLGCSAEERSIPQFVRFDLEVYFLEPPSGCISDQLSETICYAVLSEKLRTLCSGREYQLIEKLGWDAYQSLRKYLPASVGLKLRAIKETPPIDELTGGAVFTISDWKI